MNFSVKDNLISIENEVTGLYAIIDIINRTTLYKGETFPLIEGKYKQDTFINILQEEFPSLCKAYKVRIADDGQEGLFPIVRSIECTDCEKEAGYLLSLDGNTWYCPECYITHSFIICSNCGEEIEEGDETDIDGDIYCEECREDSFLYCEDCSTYHSSDDMYTVNSGMRNEKYVCSDCIESYYKCIDCGEYFTSNNVYTHNDSALCYSCRDNGSWYICDDCGDIVSADDVCTNDDGYFCENCYSEKEEETGQIHEHDYKPEAEFHGEGPLYFGIELECDKGQSANTTARTILEEYSDNESRFYIKRDGSLDCGYEIVTHPYSFDSIINSKSLFKSIMDESIKGGFTSHDANTCGLHIHVSRKGLGDTTDIQEDTIAKIIYLYEKEFASFLKFSRRTEGQLRQWAARYCDDERILTYTAKDVYESVKGTRDRYHAINLCNRSTIEFRFFRGTLNIDTFIASVQLINNLIALCKETPLDYISYKSFSDILSYSSYDELTAYANKRGL